MADYNTDIEKILGQRINTLKDLKEAIKEYKDVLSYADEGTQEWADATKGLEAAQQRLDKINKAAKGTLDQYNKSSKDSINALKERIKQLNLERNAMDMNSKEYAEATKELKILNDKLREAGTSAGDWRANVGNYANSIKSAFGELGTAAGGLTGPLGAVNASMLKLASNPVGAVVIALVGAIKLLSAGIKSSETNTNKFNQVLAPLKGLVEVITRGIQTMTGKVLDWFNSLMNNQKVINIFKTALQGIVTVFNMVKARVEALISVYQTMWEKMQEIGSKVKKVLQPVTDVINNIVNGVFQKLKPALEFIINAWNKLANTKLGRTLGFNMLDIKQWGNAWKEAGEQVEDFTDTVGKAADNQKKIAKSEADLLKRKRSLLVANAKINGEIAALDLEIAEERNKEVKDYDKILSLIDEKTSKEQEKLRNELALRQTELDIIKRRNATSDSMTKDLDAEAQAAAAVTEAENALTQAQANGEKEKRKILQAKTSEQQKKATEDYKNAVNDLNLALKGLDITYKETMDGLNANPIEAPQGADIDKESIDEYYNSMIALYGAEYEAFATMTDAKIAKLEEFIAVQKALGNDTAAQELEIAKLRQQKDREYNKLMDATNKAEKQRAIEQKKNFNATLSAYGGMLDGMSQLFEENTVAYKITATAKALIDTFLAATEVLAQQQGGMIARTAAMAGVLAAGIANVVAIWKVDPKGENSMPSAGGATAAAAEAPSIVDSTPYTYSRTLQTEEEEEQLNQPIYVSVTDINNMQNRVKVVENESTY